MAVCLMADSSYEEDFLADGPHRVAIVPHLADADPAVVGSASSEEDFLQDDPRPRVPPLGIGAVVSLQSRGMQG